MDEVTLLSDPNTVVEVSTSFSSETKGDSRISGDIDSNMFCSIFSRLGMGLEVTFVASSKSISNSNDCCSVGSLGTSGDSGR